MRRGFVDVPYGQIHYAEAGTGAPVLLLHQTPRSWMEFRHVVPLLARTHRAIAMDTLGYGESSPPPAPDSVEVYAAGVIDLLDGLGIERASVVGHHTGGVIAVELAAMHPERVDKIVLSCTPLVDGPGRQNRPKVDDAEFKPDGSHLLELWDRRRPYYPVGREDLLADFIADAIKAGPRAHGGHQAVARYEMESRLPLINAPALLIGAPGDVAFKDLDNFAKALPGSVTSVIEEGKVPLPDHVPDAFTRCVQNFLDS